jgi:hypothetical protein
MKGACLAVLFALTATLGSAAARGPERVAIHVPAMLLPPAKLKARITVEPDADLRVLAVVAESVEGYYRRSDVPLRGLDGPKTTWIDWRDLPASSGTWCCNRHASQQAQRPAGDAAGGRREVGASVDRAGAHADVPRQREAAAEERDREDAGRVAGGPARRHPHGGEARASAPDARRYVDGDWLFEFTPFDLHMGKYTWDEETVTNYDVDIAEDLFNARSTSCSPRPLKLADGKLSRVLCVFGNDVSHMDSKRGADDGRHANGRRHPLRQGLPPDLRDPPPRDRHPARGRAGRRQDRRRQPRRADVVPSRRNPGGRYDGDKHVSVDNSARSGSITTSARTCSASRTATARRCPSCR